MAVTLRTYMNNQLKAMGKTVKQAQKDAGKYKSIAAAKKAGSLYYTDKNGKVMLQSMQRILRNLFLQQNQRKDQR